MEIKKEHLLQTNITSIQHYINSIKHKIKLLNKQLEESNIELNKWNKVIDSIDEYKFKLYRHRDSIRVTIQSITDPLEFTDNFFVDKSLLIDEKYLEEQQNINEILDYISLKKENGQEFEVQEMEFIKEIKNGDHDLNELNLYKFFNGFKHGEEIWSSEKINKIIL